jgi:hypothetical protein
MFAIQEPTRREWLRIGGLSWASLAISHLTSHLPRARSLAHSAPSSGGAGRARNCIVLFMAGGPPHHDTWDPKPLAPVEIRGDIEPMSTVVPGVQVSELMPRTAQLMDRILVLRALSTGDNAHSASGYYMLTGHPHQPMNFENSRPGPPNDHPNLGGIVRRLWDQPGQLPAAVTLPELIVNNPNLTWPGQDAGYLGRIADPWLLVCDPNSNQFQIPGLGLPADVPAFRFDERRALLGQVESFTRHLERTPSGQRLSIYQRQAFDLLQSSQVREAFDLDREPAYLRDRYGRSKFGQSVLLARRLIERGVRLVQVNWPRLPGDTGAADPLWDTHQNNSRNLRERLMPTMDLAYSALLEDLQNRGLLDETLVVWVGEFGRTPRINPSAGRDHWGAVFSGALAGGGVPGGAVYGASDRHGAEPVDGRVLPADLHTTILHLLGVSAGQEVFDHLNRPLPLLRGEVIRPIR